MGQGELRKRGRVWWVRYYVGGRRYEESAKTGNKEAAQALLREKLQAIWEGRYFPGRKQRRDITLTKIVELWEEERATKRSLRHDLARLRAAAKFFGEHRQLATLTGEDIADWRKALAKSGVAVATVNRHLAALRSAINHVSARYAHQDPFAGVKLDPERNARNRVCSVEEYATLRDGASDDDLRLFVVLGYWLGMREGELAGVLRSQIRDGAIWLGAADTKEADTKSVPIPDEAADLVRSLPVRLDGRLFSRSANTYSRLFTDLCAELDIAGMRFHDLRHTAVTNLIEAGVDLVTIQTITGHKSLLTMKRYAHVSNRRRREALAAVQKHHKKAQATGRKDRS